MIGFLNINKPAGISSRRVVDQVAAIIPHEKIGHAGTLDPIATGVLVLAIGGATRLIQYLHEYQKSYRATFLLGHASESDDIEREVTIDPDAPVPSEQQMIDALPEFVGEIQQVPPAFSAIKVDGKRAYKMARRGEKVEIKPRQVSIYRNECSRYQYPELELDVQCSAGTYIRSLGRDLAIHLGTTAVMSHLVRTGHGPFNIDQSIELDSLTALNIDQHLITPQSALVEFPTCVIDEKQVGLFQNGMMIDFPIQDPSIQTVIAVNQNDQMVALLKRKGDLAKPAINFANALSE